ncbi:hypothetical protein [Clavibacter sp. Sh2088]|uniref:hypothetical protein n=1 Tax=Clavibacter sp. Sh2088 TaxID=3397676 RepID=UPI0039E124CC
MTRRDRVGEGISAIERMRALAAAALLRRDPTYARLAGVDPSVAERLRLAFTAPAQPEASARRGSGARRDPGVSPDRGR